MSKTFADGIAAAGVIAGEYGIDLGELRPFAANHLLQTHPDLEEIGTSDVSIHLSHLGNHQPELLRAVARDIRDRNVVVARVSAATGRTADETLQNLRRLFAPTDDPSSAHGGANPQEPQ